LQRAIRSRPEEQEQYYVFEVTRASAAVRLAARLTGYPIARVAAKNRHRQELDENSTNAVSGNTMASFEPAAGFTW
jgi:carbamoylphosphate synthase large subunit